MRDTHSPPTPREGKVGLEGKVRVPLPRRPGPECIHSVVETTITERTKLGPAHWGWRTLLISAAGTLVRGVG